MNEKKKPSMKRYKNLLFGRALPAGILIALQLFWIYLAVTSLLDFFPLLNGIMRVLSIIFVIVILNDRGEQSEYRLIWIIVVLLLPVFGAPFYYLFGNRKPGRNFKRRLEAANVKYHLSYFQYVATLRNIKFDLLLWTVYPLVHHNIACDGNDLKYLAFCTRNSQDALIVDHVHLLLI
jgi:cardiolipin synthase